VRQIRSSLCPPTSMLALRLCLGVCVCSAVCRSTGTCWLDESRHPAALPRPAGRDCLVDSEASNPRLIAFLCVGGLRGAAAAARGSSPAARRTSAETATAAPLTAGAATVKATTAPAGDAASVRIIVAAAVGAGLGSSCLDNEILTVDDERIRGNGCLITSLRTKLDESAVLLPCQPLPHNRLCYPAEVGRLTLVRLMSK
jgi:hypothetical protein